MLRKTITCLCFLLLFLPILIAHSYVQHDFTADHYEKQLINEKEGEEFKLQDGALQITFDTSVKFHLPFGSFFSGYDALKVDGDFPEEGTLTLTLVDIHENEYTASLMAKEGAQELIFSRADFVSSGDEKLSTIEHMTFHFAKDSSESATLSLSSMQYASPQHIRGPWIAVDPVFDFYDNIDWKEFALSVRDKGYMGAQIISIWANPTIAEQAKIVEAFHEAGLKAILRMYPSTDLAAYQQNPDWRQKMLDGSSSHDWRVYLCPNSDEFTAHQADRVQSIMQEVPYDAIELAENWFEVWGGPYPDNPNSDKYACICDNCRDKFMEDSPVDPVDLFDPESEDYFLKEENEPIYEQWVQFRIDSLISFADTLYDAAKNTRPEVQTVHMHLSDCTVEPGKSAEYQGQDLEAAVSSLQPDVVIIQDAWQDWIQADLPPDFVEEYGNYYVDKVREIKPEVSLIVHADIGSQDQMRRSFEWMRRMNTHARQAGFNGSAFYEFSVGNFSIPSPTILAPSEGERKSLPLSLQGSLFTDLDWLGGHLQTQWEIALEEDFTGIEWRKTDISEPLDSFSAGFSVDKPDATHYIRARYRNTFHQWSEWAEPVAFEIDYTGVSNWHYFR